MKIFLILNLALAFYNVGIIWAHEVDIFRSWSLLSREQFHKVQLAHWKKLPFWVFIPVGLSFFGAIALIWEHPSESPDWCIWGNLACLALSHFLTGAFWGRWQAALSKDPLGSKSPFLAKILRTHWVRTLLINLSGVILLVWTLLALT